MAFAYRSIFLVHFTMLAPRRSTPTTWTRLFRTETLYSQLSKDTRLLSLLRKDCAIFSELAYQEADYVQKCWDGAGSRYLTNEFVDTLRGLARAELILPPGPSAHIRHVELLRRCRAFPPIHCGDNGNMTDGVMYIIPYNFPWDSSQPGSPDIIILAFRGTNSFETLFVNDLALPELINLDDKKLKIFDKDDTVTSSLGNAKVDLGFGLYLGSLIYHLNEVQRGALTIPNSGRQYNSNKELNKALREKPIICTGHSLGGAASTLAELYLNLKNSKQEVGFINMGSPRVGNHHFAQLVDRTLKIKWRVVNGCDPIVGLPPNLPLPKPSGLNALSEWIAEFYYEHAGDKLQIGSPCGLTAVPPLDHCIALYIYHLTNPNSQNGDYSQLGEIDLGSWFDRYLRSPIQSAAGRVRSEVGRDLAKESVEKLRVGLAQAAGADVEGVAGKVATVLKEDGRRVLHFLAEWTHI